MKRACAECGRAFAPRHERQRRCELHEPRGNAHRSPTTRMRDSEYRRIRKQVMAEEPVCWVPGCGAPATTVDHIVPVSRGGRHERENLRGACAHHNFARRDDVEWRPPAA